MAALAACRPPCHWRDNARCGDVHRQVRAGRNGPPQPQRGRVGPVVSCGTRTVRFHRCNAVDHPCSTSTHSPRRSPGLRDCIIERAQVASSCSGSLSCRGLRRRLLVAEHLSRGDGVHDAIVHRNTVRGQLLDMRRDSLCEFYMPLRSARRDAATTVQRNARAAARFMRIRTRGPCRSATRRLQKREKALQRSTRRLYRLRHT